MRARKTCRLMLASALCLLVLAVGRVATAMTSDCSVSEQSGGYCVGASKRDITPSAPVHLGGYGFGPVRLSTGVERPIYVRAIAISRGGETAVFCAIDSQGHFFAYQGGAAGYGSADIRRRVSQDTGVPERAIIIASTHDHSGPDDIGVWGGVPSEYLKFVADDTVAAIEDALRAEQPASLYSGEIDATKSHLLRSMLPAYPVDSKLRTLVAKNSAGAAVATLINYSAHVTALGKGNTMLTPDWPARAIATVERANLSSFAMVMVASVGRTQPDLKAVDDRKALSSDDYGEIVGGLALEAEKNAVKVDGAIASAETMLEQPIDNVVLKDLMLNGKAGVDRVMRSDREPYMSADQRKVRTPVGSLRIGSLFFAAVPGESFPETQIALEARVGAQGHYLFSLAEDQLGYDPPPYEVGIVEYASPLDEGLFIISSSFGTDVTRALLGNARTLGFQVSDADYSGDDGRASHGLVDSVEGTIGRIEEPIVRRLMLLALWLGYEQFH